MKKKQLHEALAVLLTKLSSARDNPLLMDNYVTKALRTVLLEFKESGELYTAYKEQIQSTMESDNPWIGMLIVPIVATISIISPVTGNRNVMRAQPLIYTERWVAAFQGQTALPTAVTIASVGRTQKANDVVCGKARGLSIFDSLTVALTTA